jgi:hypothetical protein
MDTIPINLELQQIAFALVEPGTKVPDFLKGENETGKTEDWAVIVFGITPTDIGAYMAELVKIGDVRQT